MGCVASLACCAAETACCLFCRSLCACCGGGSKDTAPNPDAGRVGSLWVMLLAVVLSLVVQYYAGQLEPQLLDYYAWDDGCDSDACKGAMGVYRVSLCTALFFGINAITTWLAPQTHDRAWGGKFAGWLLMLVISAFIPNALFGPHGYLWVARVGGFLFVVIQQVLLIDLAYYVNDWLVALADSGEVDDWCGTPSPLVALLACSALGFAAALTGIVLLFVFFGSNCPSPDAIMGLTVTLVVVATVSQLFVSQDANLLTSSVVAMYMVYLAASALAANSVTKCNPTHNAGGDWMSVAIGLGFTLCALAYTIYSASSQVRYLASGRDAADNGPGGSMTNKIITGQLPQNGSPDEPAASYGAGGERSPESVESGGGGDAPPKTSAEVLSFNVVMALMAMQVAMVLTNWGAIEKTGSAASPSSGQVAMWMQAAAQWVAGLLYIWTCVAPTLFPDREFS
mmetsp:Transcript_19147/g.58955  ORF Transcript_19147/g.58955 Transcript_19147/m.58955 type:complete len:454 (+) Transcript_19147:167-1528(+)